MSWLVYDDDDKEEGVSFDMGPPKPRDATICCLFSSFRLQQPPTPAQPPLLSLNPCHYTRAHTQQQLPQLQWKVNPCNISPCLSSGAPQDDQGFTTFALKDQSQYEKFSPAFVSTTQECMVHKCHILHDSVTMESKQTLLCKTIKMK